MITCVSTDPLLARGARSSRQDAWALANGLLAGVAADAMLGDPRHGHPVALFGRWATAIERAIYADTRGRGASFTACCLAMATAPALAGSWLARRHPAARLIMSASCTWAVTAARSLTSEAELIRQALADGDIDEARRRLPGLCGRDPDQLDAAGIARAVVESVAENTSDAIVAPLLWGALAGPAGLTGYRAVNTLDAMVGAQHDGMPRGIPARTPAGARPLSPARSVSASAAPSAMRAG